MKIGSDNIGPLFLGTDGIGKAYLGSELVYGKELPYDAAIEYIGTTGTQYIDTGIAHAGRNIEFTLVVQWTGSTASQFETFFGYMAASPDTTPRCGIHKYNGNWMFGTNKTNETTVPVDNNLHKFFLTGNASTNEESLYIDNAFVMQGDTTSDGLFGNTITFFLGCRNRNGSVDNPSSAKFYSLNFKKFADAEHTTITQEWNFIPVRIGQVGYMYDTISGQLFGNSGSGNFILGPDVANEMSLRMSKSFIDDNPTLMPDNGGKWAYHAGLVLMGMLRTHDAYNGVTGKDVSKLLTYAKKYYHDHIGLVNGATSIISNDSPYVKTNYNADHVQPGYNLFRLKQLDSDTTYQGYYEDVIGILVDQLADQPRLVEPTSVQGTAGHPFQHKASYAMQMWLDGLFMIEPFRALYAHDRLSGQVQSDAYDDIVGQLINAGALTYDSGTQLYRHAFAGQGSSVGWADSNGRALFAWGRAMGWYIMAVCEVLDTIPSTHSRRAELITILSNLLTRLLTYRDTSGVWPLLPTLAVDTTNNKLEATSSCMYAYGYLHGVRMGYLSADMRDTALSVYQAVVRNFVTVNGASVTLSNCVTGGNPGASSTTETDVLNNYYSKPFADNDPHGVGPFIMASLEYEQLTATT